MTDHKNHLNYSYRIKTVADTQKLYSDWAATYDAEIIDNGYATPQRCADALATHIKSKTLNILDIGCGTGLSGKTYADQGFTQIDNCDINPEMLKIANSREVYQQLWLSDIENPFPFEAGKYAAISAVGVGAAPLSLFHEVTEKHTSGGLFVFSFNDHALEDPKYEAVVNHEIDNQQFELLFKEYGEHLPGRNIKSNIYVLRKI